MYCTGFADEAATDLPGQISATRALGWTRIESRKIDNLNIHDLDQAAFDRAAGLLSEAGIAVNCFGSAIGNWAKAIDQDDRPSQQEAERAIPRMRRLGTTLIRVMSYALLPGKAPAEQDAPERFRRLNELTKRFLDHGIQPVHENCNNYGGMGWRQTLEMLERVPGLKLVFDTGNPVHDADWSNPAKPDGTRARQSSWDFYRHVREHIAYVHIKDARFDPAKGQVVHTWPGEGEGDVRRIVADLLAHGYDGGFSIEPHLAVVHHDPAITAPEAIMRANYIEYGRRFAAMLADLRAPSGSQSAAAAR